MTTKRLTESQEEVWVSILKHIEDSPDDIPPTLYQIAIDVGYPRERLATGARNVMRICEILEKKEYIDIGRYYIKGQMRTIKLKKL